MFSTLMSPHIGSLIIVATLTVTVWTLDKLVIEEVQVKRNDSSIEWDKKLSDKKSKEFKEMALAVKKQLKKDLKDLQGINEIRVKTFTKKDGDIFCNFECKVNSKQVNKKDIEDTLNMSVDIGATAEISYTRINMRLNLSSLSWIDAYNDHNSSEYKNLTTAITAALSEVYQNTDDVLGFEIVSISEAHDGSLVVDCHVLVDSESNLKKNDLEETIKESTKDGSFGKMFQQTGSEEEDEKDKPPVGLIVFAAVIICLVILTFLVMIVRKHWKYLKEHSPEASFESYQSRKGDIESVTEKTDSTVPSITVDSIVLDVPEGPVSELGV